ncbi:diacylglycerol kinase family lipid kinase [Oscillochloris sp. ZM17-4]|uniref:diacylglycerol/lipid kinase family protein n=1 Tax=Oscillochloris sp. ZM17-4 TaxID=2866714 RepID=UPI001C737DF9|nr:diacylglycerol kinase family protein [Oscillochloris sp. ZM17-4]MBX0328455.1 diacylglycerol kinase family lipid kinase [Oscillochloris sp. ZM17-4]
MRTRLIFNPAAGNAEANEGELSAAAAVWRERGWQVELTPTAGPSDGRRLAREAADAGYDLVVAAGGDGTINDVINGLAGSRTALATLPLGTMNVWARELRLPLQPRAAAAAMLSWQVRPIDLGRAGDRYFLLMAGIGFDAAITAGVGADEKRRFGALAYVLRGIEQAMRVRGSRTRIQIDGRTISGRVLMVVVGNSQLYGGLVKITHRASIDDGLLDVCVIRGDNGLSALRHLIAILRRRYSHDPEIEYYRARSVHVTARPRLPVQVDGDAIGQTPMTFTVAPRALRALLPPDLPEDLAQQPSSSAERPRRAFPRLFRWLSRR